jgi:hypothetical protein
MFSPSPSPLNARNLNEIPIKNNIIPEISNIFHFCLKYSEQF